MESLPGDIHLNYLSKFLSHNNAMYGKKRWTQKSIPIEDQNLSFYIDEDFINHFNKYNHNYNYRELYYK